MRMQIIRLLDRFVLPTKKALCAGALLLLATVTACGEGDVDPSLEITRFEKAACRDSAPAGGDENCFRLTVVVNGSRSGGVGSCEVVAVDDRGADISVGARMSDLKLDPGETYDEVVVLSEPKSFDHWEPQCEPTDGAS